MDSYDHRVVAGLGGYRFSETLLELSNFVGIPPPEFRGRRVYKEYGLQKWDIQTIIRGREEDPEDPTMEFTNAYTDWSRSVEIAMQGAMACICHKYHHRFSSTTPYYLFGERNEEGSVIDWRSTESHSIPRTYMTEKEYITVNMENMLKRQILLMDKFREAMDITSQRIITAESCLLVLDDKRTELKNENETLKKKLAKYEAKAQVEEDPEELTLYNTDGEEITVDEWEARVVKKVKEAREARLEAKRRKTLPLACLTGVKRQ
jgi:hypothetical protein